MNTTETISTASLVFLAIAMAMVVAVILVTNIMEIMRRRRLESIIRENEINPTNLEIENSFGAEWKKLTRRQLLKKDLEIILSNSAKNYTLAQKELEVLFSNRAEKHELTSEEIKAIIVNSINGGWLTMAQKVSGLSNKGKRGPILTLVQ